MKLNGYMEELERRNPMVDVWDRNVSGIGISP